MTRLQWVNTRPFQFAGFTLHTPLALSPAVSPSAGINQLVGIRPNSPRQLRYKRLAWPLVSLHNQLLSTGFLERALGRWMRLHLNPLSTFLEIGAGDLSLRRFLPSTITYNAIDIAYSEFTLRRVLSNAPRAERLNLALASVEDIPLPDSSVDFAASKEVFMYLPDVAAAFREIHRIIRPGGHLACTIGNLFCTKYRRKGLQPDFRSPFHFQEFASLAQSCGFSVVASFQKGWWIPLPRWLSRTTRQLPITSRREQLNTNFLYLFQACK